MAKLTDTTIVAHPETGAPTVLLAGVDVPEWATDLVGEHLTGASTKVEGASSSSSEGSEDGPPPEGPEDGPPPKGGAGSGVEAWLAYAQAKGVEVPEGASRDDVIAAVEAAGPPSE